MYKYFANLKKPWLFITWHFTHLFFEDAFDVAHLNIKLFQNFKKDVLDFPPIYQMLYSV